MFEITKNDQNYFKSDKTTYAGDVWYYSKLPCICRVWAVVCASYVDLSVAWEKLLQTPITKPKQHVLDLIRAWESSTHSSELMDERL
jgi:hypothetical protein